MTTESTRESKVKKVKALLTQAERTNYEGEAESFNAAAARLMAKWSIEDAELQHEEGRAAIERRAYTVQSPYSADRMHLIYRVSSAMGAAAYFMKQPRDGRKVATNSKDHNTYAYIVGDPGDIDRIEVMLESLNRQMNREQARDVERQHFYGMGEKKIWNSNYIRSYARRIGERMREAYEEEIAEYSGKAEIVLKDRKALIIEELAKQGVQSVQSSRQHHSGGASAGRAAADRAEINKGLR